MSARLSPVASIRVVARQNVYAVVRRAPVTALNIECFQAKPWFIGSSVLQRRLTSWRDVTIDDGTAEALFPVRTVKARRFKAHVGSSLNK